MCKLCMYKIFDDLVLVLGFFYCKVRDIDLFVTY